jgi:hypothetical protein
MSVWYAIATANPENAQRVFPLWKAKGYKVCAFIDLHAPVPYRKQIDLVLEGVYTGWPNVVNGMCRILLNHDPQSTAIVTGGDDMWPGDHDPQAEKIEMDFLYHFGGSCGIMQPTGDRWMLDKDGKAASERICGSPWMGRDYILRANGGRGVFWPEYHQFFADEELRNVADKQRLLWQRSDLTHYHDHWSRRKVSRPEYLVKAQRGWAQDRELFHERQSQGFPGYELSERELCTASIG